MARPQTVAEDRSRLPPAHGMNSRPASRNEASSRLPNTAPKTPSGLQRFVRALRSKSFSRRTLGSPDQRIVVGKGGELVIHPPSPADAERHPKPGSPLTAAVINATPAADNPPTQAATIPAMSTLDYPKRPLSIRTDSLSLPTSIPLPPSPRESSGSDDRSPVTSIFTANRSPTTLDSPPLQSSAPIVSEAVPSEVAEKPLLDEQAVVATSVAAAPPPLADVAEEEDDELALKEELRRRKGRFIEMVYLNGGSIGPSATPPLSTFDDDESVQDRRLSLIDAELAAHKSARRVSLLEPIRRALSSAGTHHSKRVPSTLLAPSSSVPSLTSSTTAPSTGSTTLSNPHRPTSKRGPPLGELGDGDRLPTSRSVDPPVS